MDLQTALVFANERQFIIIPMILEFSQVLGQKEVEQSGSHGSAEGMFERDCTPHLPAQTKNKLFVDASTVEIIQDIYEAT